MSDIVIFSQNAILITTPFLRIDTHESLDNHGILILVMYCNDFMQRRL